MRSTDSGTIGPCLPLLVSSCRHPHARPDGVRDQSGWIYAWSTWVERFEPARRGHCGAVVLPSIRWTSYHGRGAHSGSGGDGFCPSRPAARYRYELFRRRRPDSVDERRSPGGTPATGGPGRGIAAVNPRIPNGRHSFRFLRRADADSAADGRPGRPRGRSHRAAVQRLRLGGRTGAPTGAGIRAIHVWAFPQNGGAPSFVGVGNYGTARRCRRPLGAQFTIQGSLTGGSLPAGPTRSWRSPARP